MMKILVPVKRVVDPYVRIRVKPDGSGVDNAGVKMAINPFDAIALEQAVRLREQGLAEEVIVVSLGDRSVQETLRTALAVGADRAILVGVERSPEPLEVARVLARLVVRESVGLVLAGKQAIDDDANQTGQMLGALLNWPQATFASEVGISGDVMRVVREIDGGLMTMEIDLPAVVTVDLRLNEPRFASLPNIMKAKKIPLEETTPDALGAPLDGRLVVQSVTEPPVRQGGVLVNSVEELIYKLKEEARVI